MRATVLVPFLLVGALEMGRPEPSFATTTGPVAGTISGKSKQVAKEILVRIREFLDCLEAGAPLTTTGDTRLDFRSGKPLDVGTVLGYVASSGVVFTYAVDDSKFTATTEQIRKQLRARRGQAFQGLVMIGYALRHYYGKSYSFTAEKVESEVTVKLAADYILTFVEEDKKFQLSRVDSIDPGGD